MKIRKDFVTNSSSSSFIIGKKDDETITVESVFQMIKKFYREYLKKRDAAIMYTAEHPELRLAYVEKDNYCSFKFIDNKKWDDQNTAIDKELRKKFSISVWDCFDKNYDWLECKTYQDYEKYWIEKMKNDTNYRVHAPFTITDFFEEKEVDWLHYNYKDKQKDINHVNSKSDILSWYFPYAEEAFEDKNCEMCTNNGWCDKEKCELQKVMVHGQEVKVPEEQACLYLLGRVCIHSECGYIADYIVDKLREVSEHACNHMG
jgi:hypothetical protein